MNLLSYIVDNAVHNTIEKHPVALGLVALAAVWTFAIYSLLTY